MEKLNLIKPDIRTGYLNYGKGQQVTYLQVPDNISYKELKSDVSKGAVQFKDLEEFVKKNPSRMVVIQTDNEEEGMMAVAYLSAIYNKMDGLMPDDEYDDVYDMQSMEFEDYNETYDFHFEDDDDDNEWENEDYWEETPWRIPIVTTTELLSRIGPGINTNFIGGIGINSNTNPRNQLPYWYNTRKENICILYKESGFFGYNNSEMILSALKRYKNNRHVFYLAVRDPESTLFSPDDDEGYNNDICEIILEYSAGTVDVTTDKDAREKYHQVLFENIVDANGYKLKKGFKKKMIVNGIVSMNNPAKADLIDKVIKYVTKEKNLNTVLTIEDFDVMERFKVLGARAENGEKKSSKQFEEELIGMEEVKEQIRGIMDVMRYNKLRKKMGLSVGSFHNVHMMVGAPGTAKTTVAQLLGKMMAEEKLLKGENFISVNGAELKGMYVGHSAPKVKALFDNYDIIFIDEAYAVAAGFDGESDSFSQEAISQLIIEIEKHGMDRLVMFAGYGGANVSDKDNKMKAFLDVNPGLRSRINSTIYFRSYDEEEMLKIFKSHAKVGGFNIDPSMDNRIKEYFSKRMSRDDFGNGREARSLLENSMMEAAKRVGKIDKNSITEEMLKEIKAEDVEKAINCMEKGILMQTGKVIKSGFRCA